MSNNQIDWGGAATDAAGAALRKQKPEELPPGMERGGTTIPLTKLPPLFGRGNGTELTITSVPITESGNPNVALFRKIYNDNAPQITASINKALIEQDKGFISNFSGGVTAPIKGIDISIQANRLEPVDKKLLQTASTAFNYMYVQAVVDWTNEPRNIGGARFKIGETTVVYDKPMIDEIRTKANNLLDQIKPRPPGTPRGSVSDEELPSQSVALTPGKNASVVASATPEIQTHSAQSLESFKNNPRVQEVSAAMANNGIAIENQNPSLVAGLAGASASLPKVQDVALTPTTAFALDRDKFDPAANRASVSMDVANKPFDEVWKTASVALQQTAPPAVVAQAQDLEQKQSQSAPRM